MIRRAASPAVVLVGAYALLVGGGLLGFSATPLILGIIAIVAGLAGVRRRVVATGLVLAGWGVAVLLVDQGYIVNPLTGRHVSFANLFSTHPPVEERIARLTSTRWRS